MNTESVFLLTRKDGKPVCIVASAITSWAQDTDENLPVVGQYLPNTRINMLDGKFQVVKESSEQILRLWQGPVASA